MLSITKPVSVFICRRVSNWNLFIKSLISRYCRSLGRDTVHDPTIMVPIQNLIENAVTNAVLGALTGFSLVVGMGFLLFKQVIPRVIKRIRPPPPPPPPENHYTRYLRKLKSQNKGELTEEIMREFEIYEAQFEAQARAQPQDD